MTRVLILAASAFSFVSDAMAADLPTRQPPPPDMPLGEADNILNEFFQTPLKGGNEPFVNLQLSEEQITKQLVSLAEKAAILAEESERDESYPLQTQHIIAHKMM